ncbi:MAG: Nif3-like dinuclear metal center hexameric protein [Oscillospiraceae bacterium]|nr:Nif3-like dinuclear metal center hexameric protein [Oscillospiraceae bacterium]
MSDARLLKCAGMVKGTGIVCDVGTDHAYLPVYLIKNKICSHVIASDIADGPLEAARKNISEAGYTEKISLIKSDGLMQIENNGISDVIIAGMGAETISHIIHDAAWLKSGVNLILQPMTKIPYMRKWLYENGYSIITEQAVKDEHHVYTVMNAVYSGTRLRLSKLMAYAGQFNLNDEASRAFAAHEAGKLSKISAGMSRTVEGSQLGEKLKTISEKLIRMSQGENIFTVADIYNAINKHAPFKIQEKWDNSGLIVGSMDMPVTRVLTALDITNEVIDEAVSCGADLIVSHHPVIFNPVKTLSPDMPAYRLVRNNIAAICVHTPLDAAAGGINDIIADMLEDKLKLNETRIPIEPFGSDGITGIGRIVYSEAGYDAENMAKILKEIFGCSVVRYTRGSGCIHRIAVCSGSGGSMLQEVMDACCDAYITGDIKHDVWIDAANSNIALFDCGHYYTETIAAGYLCEVIRANTNGICVSAADSNRDVVSYI